MNIVTLVSKGRICHFVKWQIRPSDTKVTKIRTQIEIAFVYMRYSFNVLKLYKW